MITEPGIYRDISAIDYHADPTPEPSLSQSLAKILLDKSPLHAWYQHPRLNKQFQQSDDKGFDLGTIAHAMLIGRGREIEVLDYPDWRKKEAQQARAKAAEAGRLAVLGKTAARAGRMVQAVHEGLELRGLGHLFQEGEGAGEVCLAWQEKNIWLRQLVDWMTPDYLTICDYKTTDLSAAPRQLGSMMMNASWPLQAAMAERGLDVLHPASAGRRLYLFVVQETEVPYQLSVCEIGEAALTMARKRLQMAVDTWRICINENHWPGYDLDIIRPDMPAWAERQWLDREIAHAERGGRQAENLGAG